ncbi:MAG: hypothetical protein ACFB9M_00575 [Myxococcota bacterium]
MTTPTFNDVRHFSFTIELAVALEAGMIADNPQLVQVDYAVSGDLSVETPSGFPAFALERTIEGAEFYVQGSGLRFALSPDADVDDGIQVSELSGADPVFTFDGREVGNGRFHPALLELNADGTGRIQNSNNVPSLDPRVEVDFGEEYVTGLTFAPDALTVIRGP